MLLSSWGCPFFSPSWLLQVSQLGSLPPVLPPAPHTPSILYPAAKEILLNTADYLLIFQIFFLPSDCRKKSNFVNLAFQPCVAQLSAPHLTNTYLSLALSTRSVLQPEHTSLRPWNPPAFPQNMLLGKAITQHYVKKALKCGPSKHHGKAAGGCDLDLAPGSSHPVTLIENTFTTHISLYLPYC